MKIHLIGTREEVNKFLSMTEGQLEDVKSIQIDLIEEKKKPSKPQGKEEFPTLGGY